MKKTNQNKICLKSPPKEMVTADFYSLLDSVDLLTNEQNKKLLLMQTIQGHANMAHGMFRTHKNHAQCIKYPNTTLEDIASALSNDKRLNMNPDEIKKARLKNIMETKEVITKILKGEKIKKLQNDKGEPLFGVPFFNNIGIINPMNVIKGFYLGSIMDNYVVWRKQLEKDPYNLEMGGGECVAVRTDKLNKETLNEMIEDDESMAMDLIDKTIDGFHLGTLANEEWADHIGLLYNHDVIIDEDVVESTKNVKNAYVRHKQGKGVSDNAAVVMAGLLYGKKNVQDGIETALGVFLADAVDTWDKYLPEIHKGGLDEQLGREIEKSGKLKITEKEKLNFIFMSAIHPKKKMPDCSQRYFLQMDDRTGETAIENHLTYIGGGKPKKIILGNKSPAIGVKSEIFYKTLEENFAKYKHLL